MRAWGDQVTAGATPVAMRGGLILGSARCGSTLVSQMLRHHPEILSLSELFSTAGPHAFRPSRPDGAAFWNRLARPSRALSQMGNPSIAPAEFLYGGQSGLRPGLRHDPYFCPPILAVTLPHLSNDPDALFEMLEKQAVARGPMPLADHYRALFADLARRGGKRIWVERSGGSLVAAGTLRQMFPEARPVLLLRDGADTALSMRDYPAARMAIWTWRKLGWLGVDLLSPDRHYGRGAIWPLISAIGGRIGLGRILKNPPSLRDCGAFWSAVTIAGLSGLRDARPLVMHYEDLCRNPRSELARLSLYLTGASPAAWIDAAADLPAVRPSRISQLSAVDRRILLDACEAGNAALASAGMARR